MSVEFAQLHIVTSIGIEIYDRLLPCGRPKYQAYKQFLTNNLTPVAITTKTEGRQKQYNDRISPPRGLQCEIPEASFDDGNHHILVGSNHLPSSDDLCRPQKHVLTEPKIYSLILQKFDFVNVSTCKFAHCIPAYATFFPANYTDHASLSLFRRVR